jgi:hypothetical protein
MPTSVDTWTQQHIHTPLNIRQDDPSLIAADSPSTCHRLPCCTEPIPAQLGPIAKVLHRSPATRPPLSAMPDDSEIPDGCCTAAICISTVPHVCLEARSTYRHNVYVDSQLILLCPLVQFSSRLVSSPLPSSQQAPTANMTHVSCRSTFTPCSISFQCRPKQTHPPLPPSLPLLHPIAPSLTGGLILK